MKLLYKIIFVFLLSTSFAQAAVESWYTYWGIGIATHNYPTELDNAFDAAESAGADRLEGSIDMLGFYWPLANNQTIVGGIISGSFDRLEANNVELQFNQYLYGVSAIHFLGNEPGKGLFFRGDVGVSRIVIQTNFVGDASSDSGFGSLAGIGYGFSISDESRLLIGINYSYNSIEGESYSSTRFTVGGLW